MWWFKSIHSFGAVGKRSWVTPLRSVIPRRASRERALVGLRRECEPALVLRTSLVASVLSQPRQEAPEWVPFVLAGIAGFEPAKMPESKSGALPLGYIPIFSCVNYCITNSRGCQVKFLVFRQGFEKIDLFIILLRKKHFYSHKSVVKIAKIC